MRKRFCISAIILFILFLFVNVSTASGASTNKLVFLNGENDAYAEIIPFNVDSGFVDDSIFAINIYMRNTWDTETGISMPFIIYSPENNFSEFSHYNIGGYSAYDYDDSSIIFSNNFGTIWDIHQQWSGIDWDGILPDTINFTGADMQGWYIHELFEKKFSFYFVVGGDGMICIDSFSTPDLEPFWLFEWVFENPDYSFGGPYCWEIKSQGHTPWYQLTGIEISGPADLTEASLYDYECIGHFVGDMGTVDSVLDPLGIEWSVDCEGFEIDASGTLIIPDVDSDLVCHVRADYDDDATYSSSIVVMVSDTSIHSDSYADISRVDLEPGITDGWDPFSIDIFMKNEHTVFSGVSVPLVIYSPDQSISDVTHYNKSGYSPVDHSDSSILTYNEFDNYWNLYNQWHGFSWDGHLPDTVNFTGAGFDGLLLHSDYRKYFGFTFQTDGYGMICIDSCSIPGGTVQGMYDWLFDAPDYTFAGPYCWEIGNIIPRLDYIFIIGNDTVSENTQVPFNALAGYTYLCCIDEVILDPCDVDWSVDCPVGGINSCGLVTVGKVDSTYTCTVYATFTDAGLTVNAEKEITIINDGSVDVGNDKDSQLPSNFELRQNSPNPFNAATEIEFSLPTACEVKLEIFNIAGRKVAMPLKGYYGAGIHSVIWNSSDVASGLYIYRLSAGEFEETRKMILVK